MKYSFAIHCKLTFVCLWRFLLHISVIRLITLFRWNLGNSNFLVDSRKKCVNSYLCYFNCAKIAQNQGESPQWLQRPFRARC